MDPFTSVILKIFWHTGVGGFFAIFCFSGVEKSLSELFTDNCARICHAQGQAPISSKQMVVIGHISSVAQSCPTLCNPMNHSMTGLPVHHQIPDLTQTHVHQVGDAIQPYPLSSPSPPAFNLSQQQGLFKWVSSSHQVVKVLEFQLQHLSFQWIFSTDFL